MASLQGPRAPLEFGGPLGAAGLLLLLPATMFHLLLVARSGPARLLGPPPYLPGLEVLWSPRALLLLLTWLGLQAALYLLPARKVAEGQELKDKSRLCYPINGAWRIGPCTGLGFQALVLTALLVGLGMSIGLPLGALPEMLLPLAFAATITTFIFSFLLYMKAQVAPASALAPGGNSGNLIYDFFLGRELNPRICSFDFKYFCELRPGLIGWLLVTTYSVGPIPRKTLSERILQIPVCLALRPFLLPPGGSCWYLDGGVWSVIPTILETSSWLWPGPCLVGCPTCYPTSTSSTSLHCWCTGRPGMSGSACRSTAGLGRSTVGGYLTASCPTSTEAASLATRPP
uniref:delta(14)-sterol reductase TM7SF2 isoform X4 n=1 Tax=Ictidomys tridecemlineatus TaxID=43179 RepID=UPI001A9E908A|nr:delta(14)-sterol reductase TM7SF2 isoform X4 [Ictidomys tridecemlineatus]